MVFFVWENGEKGIPTPQIEKKNNTLNRGGL